MTGKITIETVADWNKTPLPRRSLRAMRARWQRDYDRLIAAYPLVDWERHEPASETVRNLATAIAEIDGLILGSRIGERDPTAQEARNDIAG